MRYLSNTTATMPACHGVELWGSCEETQGLKATPGDKHSPILKEANPIFEVRSKEKSLWDYWSTCFHCQETHSSLRHSSHYTFDPRCWSSQELGRWRHKKVVDVKLLYQEGGNVREAERSPRVMKFILRA